jgi:hypothetical protein
LVVSRDVIIIWQVFHTSLNICLHLYTSVLHSRNVNPKLKTFSPSPSKNNTLYQPHNNATNPVQPRHRHTFIMRKESKTLQHPLLMTSSKACGDTVPPIASTLVTAFVMIVGLTIMEQLTRAFFVNIQVCCCYCFASSFHASVCMHTCMV